jgi:hypothetical protein
MYKRTNPAVIRAIYREMSKEELEAELKVILEKVKEETNCNKIQMLKSLYKYAQSFILSR